MLSLNDLKRLLHLQFSRQDKLLLALAGTQNAPATVKDIADLSLSAGLRLKNWNISQILVRTKGLAIRVKGGWELSPQGWVRVKDIVSSAGLDAPVRAAASTLREHLQSISDPDTRAFVAESIGCLEDGLLRAAVVFSWVGAVSVLYDHVVGGYLSAFNAEAVRRDPKWKPGNSRDDLARLKESEFLNVLEAISVIGKSVKHALQRSLELRNACGHPTSLRIGEHTVAAHMEQLIVNVFARFN